MAVEEIGKGYYVETEAVEHDPECVRLESDPGPAFRDFLFPRLKSARDEASAEVLAGLNAGRPFGDAVLDVIESFPESKTQRLRTWVEEARATRIYAWVEFSSLFRLSYGLMLTVGGPRDEVIASREVGGYEPDNVAPYLEFRDALKEASVSNNFDEVPMVEVNDEDEYNEVLVVMDLSLDDSAWTKPGLYDFRDSPPTYSGTLEAYERESMKWEADQAFEMMFEDDEWRTTCESLLEES